ncbi:hypothetical protein BDF19DRAFT_166235 [Syncephalis fuscata]|nr:hypothetical protein BDF19DRAFT_166235 [Syncephalis fuscata]
MGYFTDITQGFAGLNSIKTSTVDLTSFPSNVIKSDYAAFRYTAEQEPNPWNEIFFSHTYIAYKWTYFAIVLGVLLYACTRTIMLARFKLLKRNLLLIAFVISIIYCIFFLIHLTALHNAYVAPILFNVYTLLSGIPFDIILLHWSIIGKKLFSKKAMIPVWIITFIDTTVNILRIVDSIGLIYWNKTNAKTSLFYAIFDIIRCIVLPWVTIVTLCALLLWLGFIAYKLRNILMVIASLYSWHVLLY